MLGLVQAAPLVQAAQVKLEVVLARVIKLYRDAPVLLVEVARSVVRDLLAFLAIARRGTCRDVQNALSDLWVEHELTRQALACARTFKDELLRRSRNL